MSAIVMHGHVYQPPRHDPATGVVPVEPSAAPYHDWNERITDECYRPNAFARIVDGEGRIVRIVNNYGRMSFNVGPTLARWLDAEAPDVMERMVEGDRHGGTAIAHPFHHVILPLSDPDDARTEIAWGIADFEARFGRRPQGMWLPETGVDRATLGLLAEAGIEFTILAPYQVAVPPPAGSFGVDADSGVRLVVYNGQISHDIAFGTALADTSLFVDRMVAAAGERGVTVVATDAETFGHHHRFTERGVAHALFIEADERGLITGPLARLVSSQPAVDVGEVLPTAWSCSHGLGHWQTDCGCSVDGRDGWHQRWRAPLRAALTLLRSHAMEVFLQQGAEVFHDPMAARHAYGVVLAQPRRWDDFTAEHVRPFASVEVARMLLDSQAATLASFTSCAWFFADVARREVGIVCAEAQRSVALLSALGAQPPIEAALRMLAAAEGNLGVNGDEVWRRVAAGVALPNEETAIGWEARTRAPLDALLDELVDNALSGDRSASERAVAVLRVHQPASSVLVGLQNRAWLGTEGCVDQHRDLLTALGFAGS